MLRGALLAGLCVLPLTAHARSNGIQTTMLNGTGPSTTIDMRAGAPNGLGDTRANAAWDYGSDGTIGTFAITTPSRPTFSQRTPTQARGLGTWASTTNIWRNSSQTQTRTVVNGTTYTFWCDSANGTDTVVFTGSLSGTATCNGWPGSLTAVASGTSATGTVTGTLTHGQLYADTTPKPPVVTAAATVTSSQSVPTMGTANVAGFSAVRGTMVIQWLVPAITANARVGTVSDGTTNNRVQLYLDTGNVVSARVTKATVSSGASVTGVTAITANVVNKTAIAWDEYGTWIATNGGSVVRSIGSSTTLIAAAMSTIGFGLSELSTGPLNGYTFTWTYYPSPLPMQLSKLSGQ